MKTKLLLAVQIIAGSLLILFGLNGFLHFMPTPDANAQMAAFGGAVYQTGYIFPMMATFEILAGIAFLANRYATLMAILVMPFMLNAFLAHLFLDMKGIAPSLIIVSSIIIILIKNRKSYSLIFKA